MGDRFAGRRTVAPDMTEGAPGHTAWHSSRWLAPWGARRRGVGPTRRRPPRACRASAMGCRRVGRTAHWRRRGPQDGSCFVLRTVRGVTCQLLWLRLVRARARKRGRKVLPARGPVETGQARKGGTDMPPPSKSVRIDARPVGGAPLSVCVVATGSVETLEHSQRMSMRGAMAQDIPCEDESNPSVQFMDSTVPLQREVSYFGRSEGCVSTGGSTVSSRVNLPSLQVNSGTQRSLRPTANVFVLGADGHATREPSVARRVRFASDASVPCPSPPRRSFMASRLVQLVVLLLLQVVPDGASARCAIPPSTSFSGVSIGVGEPAAVPSFGFSCGEFEPVQTGGAGAIRAPARDAPGPVLEGPLTLFDNDNYLSMQVNEAICSPVEEAITAPTPPPSSLTTAQVIQHWGSPMHGLEGFNSVLPLTALALEVGLVAPECLGGQVLL